MLDWGATGRGLIPLYLCSGAVVIMHPVLHNGQQMPLLFLSSWWSGFLWL